jgi:hypothetical protein
MPYLYNDVVFSIDCAKIEARMGKSAQHEEKYNNILIKFCSIKL